MDYTECCLSFIKEENIGKISFIGSIIIVVLLTIILGAIFTRDKYINFKKNLKRVEKNFTNLQKERLKSEVIRQVSLINVRRKMSAISLKSSIKTRVYEAYATVEHLYNKFKGDKNPEELVTLIREALRPIRFNNGRGYFFIRSVGGMSVLDPPNPDREDLDVNLSSHQERIDVFQKIKNIITSDGEGFIKYSWPKPEVSSEERFEKIAFVKHCKFLDWIIGSGEYIVDVEEETQQHIINRLNSMVIDSDSSEYIFIYKLYDISGGNEFATMLVNPNRSDLVGKKISDSDVDAKGKMFRKEMLRGIKEQGEVFVKYFYKKPGSKSLVAKLSYFKYYPEWDWIVAKGMYLDNIEKRVTQMQKNLREEISRTIRFLVFFLIITCIIFLCVSYFFSQRINFLFEGYKKIQKEQRNEMERVNKILQIQATTDTLTELYNREYFNQGIAKEMVRSARYGSALSLIIFDIDDFKLINDTLGHLSGDEVLKDLALLCQTTIRLSDILARWGGEEFILLAPENDKKQTAVFAEKIRKAIEGYSFSIESQITCSFGVTQYIKGEDKDSFINRADQALYNAKQDGKNKVASL